MKRILHKAVSIPALAFLCIQTAHAQLFTGRDIEAGMGDAEQIQTGLTGSGPDSLRGATENLLFTVLSYMGLVAVVVIVLGSILMITGLGSDESRERIRKILIYTFVGFVIIAFAGAIVRFVIGLGS